MRCLVAIALIGLTIGCAARQEKPVERPAAIAQLAAPAAALAFDGPVNGTLPADVVARELRSPTAYVGYDESTVTYSYTRTEDRQFLYDHFNDYDRRSYTTRVGVSYR